MIAARCGRTLQGALSVPEFPAGAPPNLESVGRAAGVTSLKDHPDHARTHLDGTQTP
ncbi:hypothetical protein EMIT048CA2_80245 [Pseudomonas chlororaphis]